MYFYSEDGDKDKALIQMKKDVIAATEDEFLEVIEDSIGYIMDGYFAGLEFDIINAIRIRLASERSKDVLWD